MTLKDLLSSHLSEESKDILIVTDKEVTRRVKEYLVDKLRKQKRLRVVMMPESIMIRSGEDFIHFYIFQNSWTLRKNLTGLRYNSFYYANDEYEKIIDAILKEL
jgi:hypothetical protein